MSYEFSAAQWQRVEGFLPGRPGCVGVTAKDNRTFVNGVLWVLRSYVNADGEMTRYRRW